MILAVDVDYRADAVVAACVGFAAWTDAVTALEVVVRSDAPPAPYEPGRFYLRELPHLHSVLSLLVPPFTAIVVDGYVWLGPDRPGLGAHLYESLGGTTPVIGVAKTAFAGATAIASPGSAGARSTPEGSAKSIDVLRGTSARPLYVTAIGTDVQAAADGVRAMHGAHRTPTLLGRVDHLARAG